MQKIYVIIPAYNEEDAIGNVINDIPEIVSAVYVCDNGSTDNTVEIAKQAGAIVVTESEKGYGAACLKAMDHVYLTDPAEDDIIVYLDGDYSDYPAELIQIVEPILQDDHDLVIGSRILGKKAGMAKQGSLLPQAIFGNWLSTFLIRLIWKYKFTDLGPFRAVKISSLKKMKMADRNYGWTVEMQVKAAILKMKCCEVPVSYRKRIGESKVTGTISGSVKAGIKILYTIFYLLFKKI